MTPDEDEFTGLGSLAEKTAGGKNRLFAQINLGASMGNLMAKLEFQKTAPMPAKGATSGAPNKPIIIRRSRMEIRFLPEVKGKPPKAGICEGSSDNKHKSQISSAVSECVIPAIQKPSSVALQLTQLTPMHLPLAGSPESIPPFGCPNTDASPPLGNNQLANLSEAPEKTKPGNKRQKPQPKESPIPLEKLKYLTISQTAIRYPFYSEKALRHLQSQAENYYRFPKAGLRSNGFISCIIRPAGQRKIIIDAEKFELWLASYSVQQLRTGPETNTPSARSPAVVDGGTAK